MDFMQAVKTVLNNYATFDGRSGRAEFWWWILAYVVGVIIISFVEGIIGLGFLSTLYWLALIVPSAAVCIRRFHDIGKPAIWAVTMIIPIVNLIIALIFLTKPSDGPNEYGQQAQGPVS